ncbi:hypothetical protein C8J57DRAFT_1129245 [Mycena rebaudengoi]|nr:hypothetical protein C8J57DRAFT_1129245 [Mycena rebaudengoi]
MAGRPSRKRRRSQAFPEDEEDASASDAGAKYVESTGQDRLDKEREVWDAFKDEHVEVFDLSSSLWRRFNLVRELDQQDCGNTASLMSTLMEYIALRRAKAQSRRPDPVPEQVTETNTPLEDVQMEDIAASSEKLPEEIPPDSPPAAEDALPSQNGASPPPAPTPPTDVPNPTPTSTRDLLSTIAKLSEASIRDREEKLNLTRAACESIERSIRLIDQAIQEQEHVITLGARPGTRLAPILLPELVVPKWTKPLRVTLSPDAEDPEEKAPRNKNIIKKRKSKKGRKKEDVESDTVPLRRPTPPVIPNADPNEVRYCYCDQVSFGEMIACDNPHCKREWFHLVCTNLAAAPEGRKKWYCDDCTSGRNRKRK